MADEKATVTERSTVEKTTPVPQKSSDDVSKSSARSDAESRSRTSSGGSQGMSDKPKSSGEGDRAHPMQGKSMEYVDGPGAESYTEGAYKSDEVNELDHFNR